MDVLAVINELLNHHVLFWGKPIPTVIYLKTVLQIILHFIDEHLGCQCSNRGWLCQLPLTLASTCNLGMEILVWRTDLSFIPCGLGLCTNLSCVNWQWFQNLLGRWVDLCLGNFSEFCGVSSCTNTCLEREGRESHDLLFWQITYCLYKGILQKLDNSLNCSDRSCEHRNKLLGWARPSM